MKITFFGTRGSLPIANRSAIETGGNTTCLGIESPCLPKGCALAVDAGSGFMPFSHSMLNGRNDSVSEVHVLLTHYHPDHTQGLPLSPFTYMKDLPVTCWGPLEAGFGPREVLEAIMRPPLFPKDFATVGSHFTCKKIKNPDTKVIVCHPRGGVTMLSVEVFERGKGMVSFGKNGKYPKGDCLVIRMLYSYHPERTISYRFEEGPSGKVFVFLTDHENQDTISRSMRNHLAEADLVVMDAQYPLEKYRKVTAGYGHGTPDFCVRVAVDVGAKQLGLTHHDPSATDDDVDAILDEARRSLTDAEWDKSPLKPDDVFICRDYEEVELYNDIAL